MVRQLAGLSEQTFTDSLADCIADPDPVEQAAFRGEQLAFRSLNACRYLIDHVNTTIRKKESESGSEWRARAEHFRSIVGRERRLLEYIVAGIRARQGILPAAPNPRARAKDELARRHPGEYLAILRRLQQELLDAKAAAKAARKEQQRQDKATERAARGAQR